MRVAVYYSNKDIRIEDRPTPEIGPGEILMRVVASGICGSDVMEWYRRDKTPLVLGHEVAGIVEEIGEGVDQYEPGDRIAASHHVPCNTCRHCRRGHDTACDTIRKTKFYPGGFAEYLRLPPINVDRGVYKLPDNLTERQGTFIEPLACVIRGQRKIDIKPADTVLVVGCGISGLLHIALARASGASLVVATDIQPYRIDAAKRMGADHALHADDYAPERFRDYNEGYLADRVILCTGALSAVEQGLESTERGGTVLMFAPTDEGVVVPLDANKFFWRNDTTITTTYAGAPADHYQAMDLLSSGRVDVDPMITHVLPLDRIVEGFDLVVKGEQSIKVIIEPHS